MSVADVTVSRRCCAGCGTSLEGRRRQCRTCGDRCRKRLERAGAYHGKQPPPQLTPELRAWVRGEIDRRRREQIGALERAERRVEREQKRDEISPKCVFGVAP